MLYLVEEIKRASLERKHKNDNAHRTVIIF